MWSRAYDLVVSRPICVSDKFMKNASALLKPFLEVFLAVTATSGAFIVLAKPTIQSTDANEQTGGQMVK